MKKNTSRLLAVSLIVLLLSMLFAAASFAESVNGTVKVVSNAKNVKADDTVTLTAQTSGFGDSPLLYRWQVNKGDAWVDIDKANSREYTFVYKETMAGFQWRVFVDIDESAIEVPAPESIESENPEDLPGDEGTDEPIDEPIDELPEEPVEEPAEDLPSDDPIDEPVDQSSDTPSEDNPSESEAEPETSIEPSSKDAESESSPVEEPKDEPAEDVKPEPKAEKKEESKGEAIEEAKPEPKEEKKEEPKEEAKAEKPDPTLEPTPTPKPTPKPTPVQEILDDETPLSAGFDKDGDGKIDIIPSIENPVAGDIVTLSTPLSDVDNIGEVSYQWYCDKGDGAGSQPIEGAIEKEYTFTYADGMANYLYHLAVFPSVLDPIA